MKVLVIMDPIESINLKKDSTIAMLWQAAKLGYSLAYALPNQLYIQHGKAMGLIATLTVFEGSPTYYQLSEVSAQPLADYDVILMRQDPPFNMAYIYTTYILEQAEQDGALIINKPSSVRDCNEKLFATQFAHLMVPTVVSSQQSILRAFINQQQDVIVKPLDGMGGSGIFRLTSDSANIGSTLELLTQLGQLPIMAQRYIPDIQDGDKRILIIDGEPVPYCLARIPQQGETRGNLAAGGRGEARPLTESDYAIAREVGPVLRAKGLVFVGLDVIGNYITEINVTSPTCIREIDAAYDTNIALLLWRAIERILSTKASIK